MEVAAVTIEDDEDFRFAEDQDGEISSAATAVSPWKVLVVDDDPDVHAVTCFALKDVRYAGRGIQLLRAYSGAEAVRVMAAEADVAIILLDVVMETDDAGLRAVRAIREELANHSVRIILRTGQPGQAPEGRIVLDYDINDYKAKAELTSRQLFTAIIAALRSYANIITIQEERRIAHTVFEKTDEGIMVTDAQNRIQTVNPAFLRITGYGLDEVRGKNPSLLTSGRHDPEFFQAMWRTLHEHGTWQGELWNKHKDGGLYAEWMTITVIRDKLGIPLQFVAVFSDITHRVRAAEVITREANFDALTDLPNRRYFTRKLERLVDVATEEQRQLALLFIDLDRFKQVNDTLGHEIGDQLLVEVAHRLKSSIRSSDFVGRLGGDEFAVILEGLGLSQTASLVAGNLVATMSRPFVIEGHQIEIGASVGGACFPTDGTGPRALTQQADQAMYAAKASGRSCFRFATADHGSGAVRTGAAT